MTKPLFEIRNLHIYFPVKHGIIKAVNGISFMIHRREKLANLGESVSGKNITALSIIGLVPPPGHIVAGPILFGGHDLTKLSDADMAKVRREIAMIFQNPQAALNPLKTVGSQVGESLLLHTQTTRHELRTCTLAVLELVGLPDPATQTNQYPHELADGMNHRMMVAMGLASEPKRLIADEPTTALDAATQTGIPKLLVDLGNERELSIVLRLSMYRRRHRFLTCLVRSRLNGNSPNVFIGHSLGVVREITKRIAVMHLGKIVELANAPEFFDYPYHSYPGALVSATPIADPIIVRRRRRIALGGTPLSPMERPSGCPFCARCWKARDVWQDLPPLLTELSLAHSVACHFPETKSHEKSDMVSQRLESSG